MKEYHEEMGSNQVQLVVLGILPQLESNHIISYGVLPKSLII
jgi:hypothetical protein